MNPTAALMLSREFEQDRRRTIEARRHRTTDSASTDHPPRQRRTNLWTMLLHMPLHVPRFGPAR